MSFTNSNQRIQAVIRLITILLTACLLTEATAKQKKPAGASPTADALFNGKEVLQLRLEIPEKGIETLKKYQWNFGPQADREKVTATLREGNSVYTNVSLQLKGAAGSFRAIDDKPAFTLNFDKRAKGQRFHGLAKLSLNNSVQDPTYVAEQFSREMFLKAGVPVPRATHARVELNGRDLGLYVLVEGWDKEFLKRHFKNTKGNLYDGGFIKDVTDELSTNAGENPKDQSDRKALAEAAKESNLTNRLARLEKVLDMDRFLSFLAMDVMLWDWDGYAMNKNNWRLFHDRETGKMVFMPHGLDQMFWKPDGSILPRVEGVVARAVLEVPELRNRYFERMKELKTKWFDAAKLTNRVAEIAVKVRPALAQKDAEQLKSFDKGVADFSEAIVRRGRSLERQLSHPIVPMQFDADGVATVGNWQSKMDFGKPSFTPASISNVKDTLQIKAAEGSSIGSWQTVVWLEKGSYRLEGKARTRGLAPDPGDSRGGAGFRARNVRSEKRLTGDTDWQTLNLEFQVPEPLGEIQLACEFRGTDGEVLFQPDSIRLKHVSSK
ncbi:MAG: CotH kinase family protein [Verrucomicrobia bacterium]|nr:CotH kinase family protein [Verrucomicrobiota bacterium]